MAQAKRKRQTKHRGNAAGVVEARGRTGRPPTPEEKKAAAKDKLRERRLYSPPTWSQSAKRAVIAGLFMFVFLFLTSHPKGGNRVVSALIFAIVAMILYVPGGYYLELALYRRRMAKRQAATKR